MGKTSAILCHQFCLYDIIWLWYTVYKSRFTPVLCGPGAVWFMRVLCSTLGALSLTSIGRCVLWWRIKVLPAASFMRFQKTHRLYAMEVNRNAPKTVCKNADTISLYVNCTLVSTWPQSRPDGNMNPQLPPRLKAHYERIFTFSVLHTLFSLLRFTVSVL